ncbi:threonine/serine exporter family protein [uncultured Roseibium sp.]|uniref:threonine/serine exporter family protein n=1 Tax=uncultured Roseibium sp. TaxID=1936171 RepID=UPI0026257D12|nr:threonine/serine exporter family protein [uncultured Roseibium sp.]
MPEVSKALQVNDEEVRAYLLELMQLLLDWSWEGVVGFEEIVEKVAETYSGNKATVVYEAESALLDFGGKVSVVKVGMPGFPALTKTSKLKNHLADVFEGKLQLHEARQSLADLKAVAPPYSAFLVWLGVITVSAAFAVDIVGTWEGILFACLTAMATGVVFLAVDRNPQLARLGPLIAGFASGVIAMIGWQTGYALTAPGLLLIASTFVFIPGDSISMQAYELAQGKWSAASDRFFYSVFILVLLASGAYFASVITSTPLEALTPGAPVGEAFPWWAVYPARVFFLLGIMWAFQMDKAHFVPALIVLLLATATAQVVSVLANEILATLVASAVCMYVSVWMSEKHRAVPTIVLMVPVVFALSPGSHGIREVETWISAGEMTGVADLMPLFGNLLAIGLGMLIGRMASNRVWIKGFQ